MEIAFRHSGTIVASMKELIAKYPYDEFDSPKRSTIPSLSFWMDAESRVVELCSKLGLSGFRSEVGEDQVLPSGTGEIEETIRNRSCNRTSYQQS